MKVVAGIGNPGREYEATRHNLGFMVVDEVAARAEIECARRRFHSVVGDGPAWGERLLLLKPRTYVNLSGLAVSEAIRWHQCGFGDLLVVCDDFQLPLGQIRVRKKGSAGGHNGLASIIESLGTDEFPRLRLGIGVEDRERGREFVLSTFEKDEKEAVRQMVGLAADAVGVWVRDGIERAMELFNRKPRTGEQVAEEEGN